MRLKGILILFLTVFVFHLREAQAFNFTAVAGAPWSTAAVDPVNGFSTSSHYLSYGGGALFGFKMAQKLQMELGVLYLSRGYDRNFPDGTATEYTFTTLQLPLVLKFQVFPALWLGFGGYFSHGIGTVQSYPVNGASSVTNTPYSFSTFGADDYGPMVSLSLKFSLVPYVSLLVDGRYLLGLANVSQSSNGSIYFRDAQLLAGIMFGM